jgi:hypothetical protein
MMTGVVTVLFVSVWVPVKVTAVSDAAFALI